MTVTTDSTNESAPLPLAYRDLPEPFRVADQFSFQRQRAFLRLVRLRYTALLGAAVGGVLTISIGGNEWAGAITIVALAAAIAIEAVIHYWAPDRAWYDGRALAESVKTTAWRYAVGANPFPVADQAGVASTHEATMRREYAQALQQLVAEMPVVPQAVNSDAAISDRVGQLRTAPLVQRRDAYLRWRIQDQQAWYGNKARAYRRLRSLLLALVVLAEAVALLLAYLRLIGVVAADLSGVAVAIVAALVGWVGLRQYATLARAYEVAAGELGTIRARLAGLTDEATWSRESADAEEAISREHIMWRASRSSRWTH